MENNSDKASQISWLNSSNKLEFFGINFSQIRLETRGRNFCPPAEKRFFKDVRSFFPKHISTDVKFTFANIVWTFSTQFSDEPLFSTKCSPGHLECNFDNTDCQTRGHSSREKYWSFAKFYPTKLSGHFDCTFATPTGDFLRDIQRNLPLLASAPKKTADVISVFDNNGRSFCKQISEETFFFKISYVHKNLRKFFW